MSKSNSETKYWLISQDELDTWLDGLAHAQALTLVAPREISGVVVYSPVENGGHISKVFTRPVLSVKGVFFPPTERLFTIHKTGQEIRLDESFPERETVVFGVRPCDARGVKLLDSLFLDTNPVDSFYLRRRENTTLIGMACDELGPTCFCTSVGGAPDNPQDMDIMLYKVKGKYLVETLTEKGRFLIPGGEWIETNINPKTALSAGQFQVPKKVKWPEHFNDTYWMKFSERCLSCRACAYVCPTCRCFAIRDERLSRGEFERIRCWDACAGENYRRVAGGHKPRAEKGDRLRNRFYCKFYYYPMEYGLGASSACTGCGRCIDVCPAGVDITEVFSDMEGSV